MKQYLFCAALFSYLISIQSILIAYWVYLGGFIHYFIGFCILFSIDKIITFICKCREFRFIVLDFFQIGFFYILSLKSSDIIEGQQNSIVIIICVRVIATIIFQFLYFICTGLISDDSMNQSLALQQSINFILFTLLFVTFISILKTMIYFDQCNNKQKKDYAVEIIKQILNMISYYLTLCSLTFIIDNLGFSLIYCLLTILCINELVIISLFFLNQEQLSFKQLQLKYVSIIMMMSVFQDKNNKSFEERYLFYIKYFNLLAYMFLILVFGFDDIINMLSQQMDKQNIIMLTFILSTIFLSTINILVNTKDFLKIIINHKYFIVKSLPNLINITQQLQQNYKFINYIQIDIFSIKEKTELEQPILQTVGDSTSQFLQTISLLLKQKIDINVKGYQNIIDNINIINQVENIDTNLLELVLNRIQNSHQISYIIEERFKNGFIENELTLLLLNTNNIQNSNLFTKLRTEMLIKNVFNNQISMFMLQNPTKTLLDFYYD